MTNIHPYESWLSEQRSPRTVIGYLSDLKNFAAWFEKANGEALTPARLTPTDIRAYRAFLQDSNAKPASINRRLAAIRAYAHWAQESNQISADPARGVKLVAKQGLAPHWLDSREQHSLLSAAEKNVSAAKTAPAKFLAQRDLTVIVLLVNTGIRIGEACALKLNDIEILPRSGRLIVRQGKGEKRREIPLNLAAREALAAWLELRAGVAQSPLFAGQRGEGISQSGIHRRLADVGSQASVSVHAHTLRHTFAKNLVDRGVSLEQIASLLGHSNLNTTRIYTTPGERDLAAAVERLAG